MSAVWMRLRADMRGRWRAWLGLALLIMVFFAPALSAFAGARRTQDAYPRFLEEQRPWDVFIFDASIFANVLWKPDYEALEALPYLEASVRVKMLDIAGMTAVGDADAAYGRDLNRAKI